MRGNQQLRCLMIFRSKSLNLCFRFSNTKTGIFFSMKFDSGYFLARIQGQILNLRRQNWPLSPLSFEQCIQFSL